jgi:hypothetical protein
MFLFVIGFPGRFAAWCDAVVAGLAERSLGPIDLMHANTLEELARNVLRSGASRAVVASRQGGGRLYQALVDIGRRFIVALDDPQMALADLVLSQGLEPAAAITAVASSCAGTGRYGSARGALVLWADRDGSDALATAAAIARHLQLPVSDAEIAGVVDDLERAGLKPERNDAIAWWAELPAAVRAIAEGALGAYLPSSTGRTPPAIIWARDLFFRGEQRSERATVPIDITGRARCLLHGPYIILPSGSWSLSLGLLFSREAAEHDFVVEVVAEQPLAQCTIRPHHEGRLETALAFTIGEEADHPVSIRLSTQRAAFDGAVALGEASLLRRQEGAPEPVSFATTEPAV